MSEPAPSDIRLARKLLPYLRKEWRLYLLAVVAAPGAALLTIAQPYLLKLAIDDHITAGDVAGVRNVALLYLGAIMLSFLLEVTYSLAVAYAAMGSITRLRLAVYDHTLALKSSFFDREPTGRLLTRATSDVEALGETLTAGAFTIVLDAMLVVGILAAMLSMDPGLTGVLLLVAPPLAVTIELIRRVMRRLFLAVRTHLAALNAYLAERLAGIKVVQLYSDEQRSIEGFRERNNRYRNTTIKTNVWDGLLYAIVDGLSSMTMALMLWYSVGDWFETAMTAGLLAAFIDYVGKLFRPIREFSQKLATLQRASSALQKIFGLLDTQELITEGDKELGAAPSAVRIRDLRFGYASDNTVLNGIDLDISSGEVVALVGRTGSGKTTIGKLLTRTYDGYEGTIEVDGIELSDLRASSVRRAIGTVQQDVTLFEGDVRFNLSLGAEIPDDALWKAIRTVQAEHAVDALGGLDGQIESNGRNLSVGEGQLLSFARTMAHDPPMVILDEATASVDTLTEAALQTATEAILERKTVLVIAHRLSTITRADRIVVLDAGAVAEVGSHDELMARRGAYYRLFRHQFAEAAHNP